GHDLVLAETPGPHMTPTAHRAPLIGSAMRLGAILDHEQPVRRGELHDLSHFAGPASQVDTDHALGPWRQDPCNALRRDVLAVRIDVRKYRPASRQHDAGR